MIINRVTVGTGKRRKTVYCVCTTPTENGTAYPKDVCRMDDLPTAALVLRYLSGVEMPTAEVIQAQEAIKKRMPQPAKTRTPAKECAPSQKRQRFALHDHHKGGHADYSMTSDGKQGGTHARKKKSG